MKKIKSIITLNNFQNSNYQSKKILKPNLRILLGIFTISVALLSFEIAVTRISLIFFAFNYVFMILSLAILELGCGEIFAFYKWRNQQIRILNNIVTILMWPVLVFF